MSIFTCLGGAATGLPAIPPPSPLPGLSAAFSRRAALVGAVVSTGALAGSAARALQPVAGIPAASDALPILYAASRALRGAADRSGSDDEVERIAARLTELERAAAASVVTTPAGAIAALEWVRSDLLREDGTYTDLDFYPALIGQALGVLRSIEGGAS